MAAPQPIENQQCSYEVFEKKHYMECTTLAGADGALPLEPFGLAAIFLVSCQPFLRFFAGHGTLCREHTPWSSVHRTPPEHGQVCSAWRGDRHASLHCVEYPAHGRTQRR